MQLDNFRFDALAIQKQTDRKPPDLVVRPCFIVCV